MKLYCDEISEDVHILPLDFSTQTNTFKVPNSGMPLIFDKDEFTILIIELVMGDEVVETYLVQYSDVNGGSGKRKRDYEAGTGPKLHLSAGVTIEGGVIINDIQVI